MILVHSFYSAHLLLLLLSPPYCAGFLASWSSTSGGEGGVSSASFIQCPEIPPDMIFCSSSLSYRHSAGLRESVQADNVWIALLTSHCHPQLMKFVCSIYNPLCLQSHQIMPIQPCREFCEEVHSECISRMSMFGFKWPTHVNCAQFPREEESMCISSKREAVSCSPCQTSPSRIQILKKYCQADVAVKARVISATPFGNTSSLVVTLDRNMQRLLPPPDMRPSKKADNTVEEMPSPGFLDTNDERYLSPNGVRNANARDVPLTAKNSQKPTEGPQNDSSSEFRMQRPLRMNGGKRNRSRRVGEIRGNDRRPWREKRSSRLFETDNLRRMLLQCAGCPPLVLPSTGLSRSENRWFIIGNRLPKSASRLPNGLSMQITMLLSWQNLSAESRQLLHAIVSIPREILCYPNARVQMNFGGQTHRLPNYAGAPDAIYGPGAMGHPPAHAPGFNILEAPKRFGGQASMVATGRWPGPGSSRAVNHWSEPTISFPYDSYLQNDAGLVNAKNLSRLDRKQRRMERRRLRKEARRLGLPFGKYNPNASAGPAHPPKMSPMNGHPLPGKKERRRRGDGSGRKGNGGRRGKDGRRLTKEERRKRREERRRRRQMQMAAQASNQPTQNAAVAAVPGHSQYRG